MRQTWLGLSSLFLRERKTGSVASLPRGSAISSFQTDVGSRIDRVFVHFPSTVIWPPSNVGERSCHFRPHNSPTRIPEA